MPPIKEVNPGFSFKISQAKIGARITCKSIIRDTSEAVIYFGPVNIRKLPIGTQTRHKIKRYKTVSFSTEKSFTKGRTKSATTYIPMALDLITNLEEPCRTKVKTSAVKIEIHTPKRSPNQVATVLLNTRDPSEIVNTPIKAIKLAHKSLSLIFSPNKK